MTRWSRGRCDSAGRIGNCVGRASIHTCTRSSSCVYRNPLAELLESSELIGRQIPIGGPITRSLRRRTERIHVRSGREFGGLIAWAKRDESRLRPEGVRSIRQISPSLQWLPTARRVPRPESGEDVVNAQTVDVLSDPGLESEAFDGGGDCEGQIPEGSDGVSGVVEHQPPVEEQIANGVGWG